MSKTIYLASRGSYSDYDIVAMFETAELRDRFIERMNRDIKDEYGHLFPEQMDLWDSMPPIHTEWVGNTRLDRETGVPTEDIYTTVYNNIDATGEKRRVRTQVHVHDYPHALVVSACGPTEKAVLKAISDRVAQIRAEKEGIA